MPPAAGRSVRATWRTPRGGRAASPRVAGARIAGRLRRSRPPAAGRGPGRRQQDPARRRRSRAAWGAGLRVFGENRVQEARGQEPRAASGRRSSGTCSAPCSRTRSRRPRPLHAPSTRSTGRGSPRRVDREAARARPPARRLPRGQPRRRGEQARLPRRRASPRPSRPLAGLEHAADRGPDGDPAAGARAPRARGPGSAACASCATSWPRAPSGARLPRLAVDGHERRLRGGDRGGGDPRARRHRAVRRRGRTPARGPPLTHAKMRYPFSLNELGRRTAASVRGGTAHGPHSARHPEDALPPEDAGLRPRRGGELPRPGRRGARRPARRRSRSWSARTATTASASRRPSSASTSSRRRCCGRRRSPTRSPPTPSARPSCWSRRPSWPPTSMVQQAIEQSTRIERGSPSCAPRRELQLKLKNTLDLFQRILEAEMEEERSDRHHPHPAAQAARGLRSAVRAGRAPAGEPAASSRLRRRAASDARIAPAAPADRAACSRTATARTCAGSPPASPRRSSPPGSPAAAAASSRPAAAPSGSWCSGGPRSPPQRPREPAACEPALAASRPSRVAGAARARRCSRRLGRRGPGPRSSTSPARRRWRSTSATGRCATST